MYMVVKGVLTYEDEFGSHPTGFCFAGINIAGDKLTQFQDCPLKAAP
jgi:hypothetical protein